MRANSIFSNLTEDTTVAEIKLILSSGYKKKRSVIMLEGEDDIKLFRFLVDKSVTLIKAYGASTTIDKFMPEHFPTEPRVIGIRDRDYQKRRRFPRIFYCDYCSAEMMLVSNDETFERVCENFYIGNLSPLSLRKEILSKLFFISVIRKLSAQNGWGYKISDTDLSRIINPQKTPSLCEVLDFVRSYNQKKGISVEQENKIRQEKDSGREEDYLSITNGHDFLEVLRVYCTFDASNNRRRFITEKSLGGALRCAYSLYAFSQTDLYRELEKYGEQNGLNFARKQS